MHSCQFSVSMNLGRLKNKFYRSVNSVETFPPVFTLVELFVILS